MSRLDGALAHLRRHFGAMRAVMVTGDRVTAYERARLAEGASRSTINKELAALRRGFNLAIRAKRLPASARPAISTPAPKNARRGFFEREDFEAVLAQLPDYLAPVMEFAYYTGWRVRSEVLTLTWDRVDFTAGTVRLDDSKNGTGRVFPFGLLPELKRLLERQWKHRAPTTYVFHRGGRPIKSFDEAWKSALARAAVKREDGLEEVVRPQLLGRIAHDFRRTAARNLRRAGVDEGTIMKLCGWKTRTMFDRYNIIDTRDLDAAVAKLAAVAGGKGS